MERLDLRLVEYFVTVAEELHFGRAAARLHIAQPSLSQQIQKLEQQLGVALLDRSSRRVELTAAGEALLRDGRRVLGHAQQAIHRARAASHEQLMIGFGGSAGHDLLPDVLRDLRARCPEVRVSLRELRLDQAADVLGGEVDAAFTRLEPGQVDELEVELEILSRESRVVAVPATHLLAQLESVEFRDLREESFIVNPVFEHSGPPARWLAEQQRHGLPGRVVAEAASLQEILNLVASGTGICLVPRSVASMHPRADVRYPEVRDADPALVSLVWARSGRRPVVDAFVRIARDVAHARSRSAPAGPAEPAVREGNVPPTQLVAPTASV